MIHLIYIYLIINSFIVGFHFNERYRFESREHLTIASVILFLFGSVSISLYFISIPLIKAVSWVFREIGFQYRFYFTDYWDKILLDDSYSEKYKTTQEKLERSAKIAEVSSKQVQRHNRQIQKKYATQPTL